MTARAGFHTTYTVYILYCLTTARIAAAQRQEEKPRKLCNRKGRKYEIGLLRRKSSKYTRRELSSAMAESFTLRQPFSLQTRIVEKVRQLLRQEAMKSCEVDARDFKAIFWPGRRFDHQIRSVSAKNLHLSDRPRRSASLSCYRAACQTSQRHPASQRE